MSKQSPLQIVKNEHGSKAELAAKVYDLLDEPEDDDEAAALKANVETMSNRKLLRLWNAYAVLDAKFGSKDELIDAVVSARFPGGNDDYAAKLTTFTVPKLLDLGRQFKLVKPAELRWR